MRIKYSLLLFALFATIRTFALDGPGPDPSRAETDGPHVFFRGKGIVVKTLESTDTDVFVKTDFFPERKSVSLKCKVSETGDTFSFRLKDTLKIEPDWYNLPSRILVLSDIEGNFAAMKIMLQGINAIDKNFKWTFGAGHLVLVGDFFDRGLNVTECLWLIYKLEQEAERAGGKVHFILGNHEIMNLSGNYTYVRQKYLENARRLGEGFNYKLWFDTHSELGRWLRTKNAVETIGDYVFCHGGISPELVSSGVPFSDINFISRQFLGKSFETILSPNGRAVFNQTNGIFWYRDGVRARMTTEEFNASLAYAGGQYLVVGHTMVPEVLGLYDGRLICVDLYHEDNLRSGIIRTLYIEEGRPYAIDSRGEKSSILKIDPRKGN